MRMTAKALMSENPFMDQGMAIADCVSEYDNTDRLVDSQVRMEVLRLRVLTWVGPNLSERIAQLSKLTGVFVPSDVLF